MSDEHDATKPEALDPEATPASTVSEAEATVAETAAEAAVAETAVGEASATEATAAAITTEAAAAATTEAPGPVDATAAISPVRRRSLAVLAGISRLLRFAFVLAIFVGGIALGYQAFLSSQPVPTGASADPALAGGEPPPVVREFITAVGSNDADGIRSAVPADPYKSFTSEMSRWEFQEVTSVETLATYVDGPRTATAFMMIGLDNAGNPIAINLVVETEGGAIVGFK